MDRLDHGSSIHVEAVFRRGVANLIPNIANDFGNVKKRLGRDLATDEQQSHRHVGIAGNARHRIMSEALVKHGVGDLIAKLVRVPLRHGLGGEEHVFGIY